MPCGGSAASCAGRRQGAGGLSRPGQGRGFGEQRWERGPLSGSTATPSSAEPAIRLIRHRAGALRLRHGRGQLQQLQALLDHHSFWAPGRTPAQLRRMLAGSQAVVSAWRRERLVGFGRATSDGVFRAVLWDVVVAGEEQGRGLGRRVVEALLEAPALRGVERVYLMTTNSAGFYTQLGFDTALQQKLMLRQRHSGRDDQPHLLTGLAESQNSAAAAGSSVSSMHQPGRAEIGS